LIVLRRSAGEFDNARKRAVREQQEFREYAAADVIRKLFAVSSTVLSAR